MVVELGPDAAVFGLGGAIRGRSGLFAAALGLAAVAGDTAVMSITVKINVVCYSQ